MKKQIVLFFIVVVCWLSCTNEFEQINTNPNSPTQVQSSLLLRQVIYNFAEEMSYEGFVAGDLLSQHRTAVDFNLFDRHALKSPQLGGNPWPILYTNLRDNELLLQQAISLPTYKVYEGPARIMKAYMASVLTDLFGDVPYLEAFQGTTGTVTPKYDQQENIYLGVNGILWQIDEGIKAIDNYSGAIPLEGDILYAGDLDKWKLFAYSLKLRCLMRISDRVNVKEDLNSIFDSNDFIQFPNQNATFDYSATQPNNFRMARLRIGDFNNFVMSQTSEQIFNEYNDPRIEILFQPVANSTQNEFKGLLNGIDASQTSIEISDYSLSGSIFRNGSDLLDANYMTSWETKFLLAEAAEKGLISADGKALYESAVSDAFDYWHTTMPNFYLIQDAAWDNPTRSNLELIITQKWLASTFQDYQGWIEWRRTGFPVLQNVSASLNNGAIPVRMPYPSEEEALNAENYIEASANSTNNSINHLVWWDVE